MSITESWGSIDRWLSRHAPATCTVLAPPATDAELQPAVALPPELIESLRCHNGLRSWANLLPEAQPSSADEIASNWQTRMDLAADLDRFTVHPPDTEPYWHPAWIPWADSDGDLQVVDSTSGRLGMAYHDGAGDFADSWPSLTSYLDAVVTSLYTGTGVNGWYPYLTTYRELWWDRDPDRQSVNDEPLVRAPVQK